MQVGKRWLRYYKPISLERSAGEGPDRPPAPVFEAPLELPNTSQQRAGPAPSRQSRFGILQGYSLTICTRAAEFKDIFSAVAAKLEELARWVEETTAVAESSISSSQSTDTSNSSSPQPVTGEYHRYTGLSKNEK